jgi:hypothetical protein
MPNDWVVQVTESVIQWTTNDDDDDDDDNNNNNNNNDEDKLFQK